MKNNHTIRAALGGILLAAPAHSAAVGVDANGPDGIGILNGIELPNTDPTVPGIRVPESVTGSCFGEPTWLTVQLTNTAAIESQVTGVCRVCGRHLPTSIPSQ